MTIKTREQLFDLFYESFRPIKRTDDKGWFAFKGGITRDVLYELWESDQAYIGCRFKGTTHYGLIDIDTNSPYHNVDSLLRIQEILHQELGLTAVLIQSSSSKGVHMIVPFTTRVRTWSLALALKGAMMKHGLVVDKGVLELFPNTKHYQSMYLAVRTPGQQGQYLLNNVGRVVCGVHEPLFVDAIDMACRYNSTTTTITKSSDAYWTEVIRDAKKALAKVQDRTRITSDVDVSGECSNAYNQKKFKELLRKGWLGKGTTNTALRLIVQHCVYDQKLRDVSEIEDAAKEILHYYTTFDVEEDVSAESRRDISNGWIRRWAKTVLKYRKANSSTTSKSVKNKLERRKMIEDCLTEAGSRGDKFESQTKLIYFVSQTTGIGDRTLKSKDYLPEIKRLVSLFGLIVSD